jgi:hypothetical protein
MHIHTWRYKTHGAVYLEPMDLLSQSPRLGVPELVQVTSARAFDLAESHVVELVSSKVGVGDRLVAVEEIH